VGILKGWADKELLQRELQREFGAAEQTADALAESFRKHGAVADIFECVPAR